MERAETVGQERAGRIPIGHRMGEALALSSANSPPLNSPKLSHFRPDVKFFTAYYHLHAFDLSPWRIHQRRRKKIKETEVAASRTFGVIPRRLCFPRESMTSNRDTKSPAVFSEHESVTEEEVDSVPTCIETIGKKFKGYDFTSKKFHW
ncbi:hypothetical protein KM043_004495 [Ampulex compressa]|nr:hypothetical protein KM043_004495 [Ampulex compressa]